MFPNQCALCSVPHPVCSVPQPVCNVPYPVCSVPSLVCSVQSSPSSVQCANFSGCDGDGGFLEFNGRSLDRTQTVPMHQGLVSPPNFHCHIKLSFQIVTCIVMFYCIYHLTFSLFFIVNSYNPLSRPYSDAAIEPSSAYGFFLSSLGCLHLFSTV